MHFNTLRGKNGKNAAVLKMPFLAKHWGICNCYRVIHCFKVIFEIMAGKMQNINRNTIKPRNPRN